MPRLSTSVLLAALLPAVGLLPAGAGEATPSATGATNPSSPYARWANGIPTDPDFFPLTVWGQSARNATKFREAGVNMYVSLHKGPTPEQVEELRKHNMPFICAQNDYALQSLLGEKLVVGWMHGDEPDNARSLKDYWKDDIDQLKKEWPQLKDTQIKWAVPIPPKRVQEEYAKVSSRDRTRPVLLNLGRSVAYEKWGGRGHRSGAAGLEDYPEYVKAADIVCYDIYPAGADTKEPEVQGKLWYVAKGIMRLRKWTRDEKIVWNCVEASNWIPGQDPGVVRSEVWMSLIHGSRGIVYFVHQFKPKFIEASVFANPRLAAGFTEINRQVQSLAPVLNSPTVPAVATVASSVPASKELAEAELQPIALMVKRHGGATYVFSVRMEGSPARGEFQVKGLPAQAQAEVLGENRTVAVTNGRFADDFAGYQVHLYQIVGAAD